MHRQLAQQLRSAIAVGTYKTGDRIPAEPELALKHGVSRITARQAVMRLASWLPKLTREQIAQHSSYHLFRGPLKIKVANANLSIRARAATPKLRRTLRLRGREPLIALERVSYDADGAPIEYTLYWTNAETHEFVLRLRGAVLVTSSMQEIR